MAVEEVLATIPEELTGRVDSLITLFKALGILAIGSIIFMLVKSILTFKTFKKINEMYEDIKRIKKKLKIRN